MKHPAVFGLVAVVVVGLSVVCFPLVCAVALIVGLFAGMTET